MYTVLADTWLLSVRMVVNNHPNTQQCAVIPAYVSKEDCLNKNITMETELYTGTEIIQDYNKQD